MEQPLSIQRALNNGGRIDKYYVKLGGLEQNKHKLLECKHLVLGCGTSYHSSYGLWIYSKY